MAEKTIGRKTVAKKTVEKPTVTKSIVKKGNLTMDVLDASGKVVGSVELASSVFGLKPNKTLMAQAVRVYLANQRLGTADTKGRGEVRGGGRKPWRQKGTGRARTGSIRDPHWRGGGVVFGPHPRDFSLEMPKTMKRKALASALSDKVLEKNLIVINEINFKEPKTKEASLLLKNLNLNGKSLLAAEAFAEKETKALNNLKATKIMTVSNLNTYEVLNTKKLLITQKGIEAIEKLLIKA